MQALRQRLFEPKSTDRKLLFRERTIRYLTPTLIVLSALSLISVVVIFGIGPDNQSWFWSISLALVFLIVTEVAILQQRVGVASYLLVSVFIFFSIFIQFTNPTSPMIIPLYMVAVLIMTLILPQGLIVPLSLGVFVIATILTFIPTVANTTPDIYGLTRILIPTAVLLVLQYLFRSEYESDLLSRERLRYEAENARRDAENANRTKSQFLANMSHELRTPLNSVIGYGDILKNGMAGTLTTQQVELTGYIVSNGHRLLRLINEVLDLSRIEAGRAEIIPAEMSPVAVVKQEMDNLRSLADNKHIYLRLQADQAPEKVTCDVDKFRQVLVNLLSNAVKFTHEKGVTVTICRQANNTWDLMVEDTGIGMPPGADKSIFDAFSQLDTTDKRSYEGTGLGLTITKRLVAGMGGTVQVKSQVGIGSTFTVTLPYVVKAGIINLRE